jgi:predicted MFS family arabinose efflux permease
MLSSMSAPPSDSDPALWRVVCALGVTQIVAWGSLHYSIAVLGADMARSFGVSISTALLGFTGALVMSGLAAPAAGRWIDRRGGRLPMAGGSLLAAAALALIAASPNVAVFCVGWLLAGIAMAATLYDAAFATLSPVSGQRHRKAVTVLTLFGGLASTVFWPLSFALNQTLGWRWTLAVYAALHLLVCLPLHAALLPRRAAHAVEPGHATAAPAGGSAWGAGLAWLAASFGFGAVVFSAMSVHLIATLQARGLDAADAVLVSVLVGPMQLAGRVVEFAGGRRLRAVTVGVVAMLVMLAALLVLLGLSGAGWPAFAFAALYGASNGVMTIVRGTVPAELYGREGYGSLLGRLAGPAFIGKAAAPVAFALLATQFGHAAAVSALVVLALLSLAAYGLAVREARAAARSRVGFGAGPAQA